MNDLKGDVGSTSLYSGYNPTGSKSGAGGAWSGAAVASKARKSGKKK